MMIGADHVEHALRDVHRVLLQHEVVDRVAAAEPVARDAADLAAVGNARPERRHRVPRTGLEVALLKETVGPATAAPETTTSAEALNRIDWNRMAFSCSRVLL